MLWLRNAFRYYNQVLVAAAPMSHACICQSKKSFVCCMHQMQIAAAPGFYVGALLPVKLHECAARFVVAAHMQHLASTLKLVLDVCRATKRINGRTIMPMKVQHRQRRG
jgi:hypothetical protein